MPFQEHNIQRDTVAVVIDADNDGDEFTYYYPLNKIKPHPRHLQSSRLTKRQHALRELLSSERAYASDLALIREVHIPLALGRQILLSGLPPIPPVPDNQSDICSPMKEHDVKVIFGNICEIAEFSDALCGLLEEAFGDFIEGGKDGDHVGALFLKIIPELERRYKKYITRHPTALAHLRQLPQTPVVKNYFSYSQTITTSLSRAWDLSSLLTKPIQHLHKYSILLAAIINETPDTHLDKKNLLKARQRIEEVAKNVNEGRRRAEIVHEVLVTNKKKTAPTGPSIMVPLSVNLTKKKTPRATPASGTKLYYPNGGSGGRSDQSDSDSHEETILVARLERELKQFEDFAQRFAKNIVEWARMTSNFITGPRTWALGFARVIGLPEGQECEALSAFLAVVKTKLMPLCVDLEAVVNDRVLKGLARLLMTMTQPLKLLASMNEQEPYHRHLMTMTASPRNRPPPSLLAASANYLALRGQLAVELPMYITLLHRGLGILIQRLSAIQTGFWKRVHKRWAGLWEMLRLEKELNLGGEETVSVWYERWSKIDEHLATTSIVQQRKLYRKLRDQEMDRGRESEEREREREKERRRVKEQGVERKNAPPPPPPPPPPLSQPPQPPPTAREQKEDPKVDPKDYAYHHILTSGKHQEISRSPSCSAQSPPSSHSSGPPSTMYFDVPNTPNSLSINSHSAHSPSTFRSSNPSSIFWSDILGTPSSFAASVSLINPSFTGEVLKRGDRKRKNELNKREHGQDRERRGEHGTAEEQGIELKRPAEIEPKEDLEAATENHAHHHVLTLGNPDNFALPSDCYSRHSISTLHSLSPTSIYYSDILNTPSSLAMSSARSSSAYSKAIAHKNSLHKKDEGTKEKKELQAANANSTFDTL